LLTASYASHSARFTSACWLNRLPAAAPFAAEAEALLA